MSIQPQQKRCPTCGALSLLDQAQCPRCGRMFTTPFAPLESALSGTEQTMAVPQGGIAPESNPLPYYYATPFNPAMLGECARHYRILVFVQVAGTAILLSGPLTLVLVLVSTTATGFTVFSAGWLSPVFVPIFSLLGLGGLIHTLIQKSNLRRQVAGMGLDCAAWAAPMDRAFRLYVGPVGALVAALSFAAFLGLSQQRAVERKHRIQVREQRIEQWLQRRGRRMPAFERSSANSAPDINAPDLSNLPTGSIGTNDR